MHSKWLRRVGTAGLFGAVAYASVGCGAERDPINRVQPQALKKSFFVGENLTDPIDDPQFYMRNTVVDVPYGADQDGLFTASYAQPVSRIKWQINENELVARLSYELVEDAEHRGSRYTNDGQVVAAFRIESQFDVRNDYNPSTGEQTNVAVENSTDRPWYEREYIRVDWSKNLITTAYQVDTLSQLGLYGGVEWESLSLYVNEPSDPNAPVFATDEGYFDVTVKAFAKPTIINTIWGQYPSCFLAMVGAANYFGVNPITTCAPAEATLRLSFKKIVDTDFEASEWDGNRMDAFGVFFQERQGYDRNYGLTDTKWHRFADKFNVWKRSHLSQGEGENELFAQCGTDVWRDEFGQPMKFKTYSDGTVMRDRDGTDADNNFVPAGFPIPDPNGAPLAVTPMSADPNRGFMENGSADECAFYVDGDGDPIRGSRCDVHAQRCTKPMFDREIKTIPWYYGPDAPTDLFASTAKATEQWNYAVKSALQAGKKAEWDRLVGGRRDSGQWNVDGSGNPEFAFPQNDLVTEAQLKADDQAAAAEGKPRTVPHVFVLCHNPVIEGDDAACGKVGLKVRLGDLRYHTVNLINTPQIGSPWGIMVDAADPITGEKISASINEWVPVLDAISQGAADTIRWLNGEITDDDVIKGRHVEEWLKATNNGLTLLDPGVRSQEEIQNLMAAIEAPRQISSLGALPIEEVAAPGALQKALRERGRQIARELGPSQDATFEANRLRLQGSKFEAMMMTPDALQRVGVNPQDGAASVTESMLDQASHLRALNPQMRRWKERLFAKAQAANHFCMVEAEDSEGYVALARQAQFMFPLPDKDAPNYTELKFNRDKAIWTWLREQFHIAVIAHEMGHSVSLRHNFVSNFDALNFHKEYWQLRTNNGKEPECTPTVNPLQGIATYTTPQADGNTCAGPRWVDPITERELNGNIWKWGGTTVMDYPGDMAQETNGLGMYDRAAMRFVYADLVDVDSDAGYVAPADKRRPLSGLQPDQQKANHKFLSYQERNNSTFGGVLGPMDFTDPSTNPRPGRRAAYGDGHYTSYPDRFGVLGTCGEASDPNNPLTAECSGPTLLHRKVWDMASYKAPNIDLPWSVDPDGRARRPYMFGSDEYADSGNVFVFRNDAGADNYEQMQFLVNNYENRYVFTHFRKKNRAFSTNGVVGRIEARYLDKMGATTKALGLLSSLVGPSLSVYTTGASLQQPQALASALSFDAFSRILTRPEPGYYYYPRTYVPSSGCYTNVRDGNGPAVVETERLCLDGGGPGETIPADFVVPVGSGQGRYIHNEYDYTKGYFWGDYQMQVGSYYEKVSTAYYLLEAYNNFVQNSKDDYIDGRMRNINYTTLYPEQMRKLFAFLMQGDHSSMSPYANVDLNKLNQEQVANINFPSWVTSNVSDKQTPAGSLRLDPLVGWEQQLPMLMNGFYFGGTTLTMDWVQMMRVATPSGSEAVSYGDDNFLRYVDPLTGILYVARTYGNENVGGLVVERGIGGRMLQYANEIATASFKHTVEPNGDITWQRNSLQEPVCADDSNASQGRAPSADCAAAMTKVRYFSSNLDVLREMADWMGYGPLSRR